MPWRQLRSGGIAPRINIGTRWRWVVNFKPRPLPPPPGTHWVGGLLDPKTGLDAAANRKSPIIAPVSARNENQSHRFVTVRGAITPYIPTHGMKSILSFLTYVVQTWHHRNKYGNQHAAITKGQKVDKFIKRSPPRSLMRGATPPLPNTPSWLYAQLKHRDSFTFTLQYHTSSRSIGRLHSGPHLSAPLTMIIMWSSSGLWPRVVL
jgi:hypothetical protein